MSTERREVRSAASKLASPVMRVGDVPPQAGDAIAATTYEGQCAATKPDGKRCRKQAMPDSTVCDTHQPGRVLNRKMRRGLKHGGGLSSQLDHGVRQGG